ncbi:hypothetical protein BH09BAC6_BH09BAC6_00410 [soil metagenome]
MKYTYLLIDLLSLLVPLLFSFHPKIKFYRQWRTLFLAIIVTSFLFIPFDIYFTYLKVWGFNPAYISGYYISNLPVEEILFFICIPYSCLFTYHCLSALFSKEIPGKAFNIFTGILIGFSLLMAVIFYNQAYTLFAFALTATSLCIAQFVAKVKWLPRFYCTYAILLLPFLIVNGLLTGTGLKAPIVWYNNTENMNLRILTIPVEDVFYGLALILLNLLIFKTINQKHYYHNKTLRAALRATAIFNRNTE